VLEGREGGFVANVMVLVIFAEHGREGNQLQRGETEQEGAKGSYSSRRNPTKNKRKAEL
jgi:hypothetical protein